MLDKQTIDDILSNDEYMLCSCYVTDCEWHGKCKECVALHRFCGKLPTCLEKMEEA